jgi:hypothetical protein
MSQGLKSLAGDVIGARSKFKKTLERQLTRD